MPSAKPFSDKPQFYGRRLGRKLRPKQQQVLEWGLGHFGITAGEVKNPRLTRARCLCMRRNLLRLRLVLGAVSI